MTTSLLFFTEKSVLKRMYSRRLMSINVKVTSYNVLSSHLSEPNYFTSCHPNYLAPQYRLDALKLKLNNEVESKAVICLQEVSQQWAGELHTYFANKGYHFVTGLYGNKFDGYMGVGMAVPLNEYDIASVNITRIADTKRLIREPRPVGFIAKSLAKLQKIYTNTSKVLGFGREEPELWDSVTHRFNQMVCVRLTTKETKKSFVVGTYHMPCMFKLPSVMVTHCALSAQHIKKVAGEDPFVFAGDFNIKPDSSMYRVMTQGRIDKEHPEYPVAQEGDSWVPDLQAPLTSAYHALNGAEPDFTNYAKVQQQDTFIDTLDYIFLSPEWRVKEVAALPLRGAVEGPLPNKDEPSDHILISATLELP